MAPQKGNSKVEHFAGHVLIEMKWNGGAELLRKGLSSWTNCWSWSGIVWKYYTFETIDW